MPEVSRFFGIAVRFYYNDHEPGHFHAVYGEHEALIEIDSLAVLRGQLPRRALAMVLEWQLSTDLNSSQTGRTLAAARPLFQLRR